MLIVVIFGVNFSLVTRKEEREEGNGTLGEKRVRRGEKRKNAARREVSQWPLLISTEVIHRACPCVFSLLF
jgi:hypothetical protein